MNASKPIKIATLGKTVKVLVNKTIVENHVAYSNVNLQLIEIIAQALGLSYEFMLTKDSERGKLLPDGNWTGVIGMVHRGEIDLAISSTLLTEDRCKVVSCSFPYGYGRMTFVTRNPEYAPGTFDFVKPFSYQVWILLAVFLALTSFSHYIVFKRKQSVQSLVLQSFGALLRQPFHVHPRQVSERVALLSWIMGTMFLGYCYTAVLLAFITFPRMSAVRTIPELGAAVVKGTHQCFTLPGTFIADAFLKSSDPSTRIIGEDLLKSEATSDIGSVLENKDLPKIPAFIAGETTFVAFEESSFVSKDTFFPIFQTMPMRKNFCCKRKLNNIIHHVIAGGLYQKLTADNGFIAKMKKHVHFTEIEDKEKKLTLADFEGEFIFLLVGLGLSFVIFICELVIGKYTVCIDLKFGRILTLK